MKKYYINSLEVSKKDFLKMIKEDLFINDSFVFEVYENVKSFNFGLSQEKQKQAKEKYLKTIFKHVLGNCENEDYKINDNNYKIIKG
jgi:hypothetical protein